MKGYVFGKGQRGVGIINIARAYGSGAVKQTQGIDMVIANGDTPSYLYDIVDGKNIGTRFIGEK